VCKTTASSDAEDDEHVSAAEMSTAEDEVPAAVEVPLIDDDELTSFFITPAAASQPLNQQDREEADIDAFNDIFIDSNDMYVTVYVDSDSSK